MKTTLTVLMLATFGTMALAADDPAARLSQARLQIDLGQDASATAALQALVADPAASAAVRGEALVRLALVRTRAGQLAAAADALETAMRSYGGEEPVVRLVVQAAGGALPGAERWGQVWRQVKLDVDRGDPARPRLSVSWPGARPEATPRGNRISLDLEAADLGKLYRTVADVSGLNIVVHPGTRGEVTFRCQDMPWDVALHRVLSANGLDSQLQGNVLYIADAGIVAGWPERRFAGKAVTVDFNRTDLVDALRRLASLGGLRADVDPAVGGKVTLLLSQVPWDQALDVLARTNGLTWERAGETVKIVPAR